MTGARRQAFIASREGKRDAVRSNAIMVEIGLFRDRSADREPALPEIRHGMKGALRYP